MAAKNIVSKAKRRSRPRPKPAPADAAARAGAQKLSTREQLLEQVWDWTFGDVSTVTVHVRRLREKIEVDAAKPTRLVTVWGVGYRYEPEGGGAATDSFRAVS